MVFDRDEIASELLDSVERALPSRVSVSVVGTQDDEDNTEEDSHHKNCRWRGGTIECSPLHLSQDKCRGVRQADSDAAGFDTQST